MRHQTGEFITKFLETHAYPKKVLEVGSLDVNGNIRRLLDGNSFIGIDMRPGACVDIQLNAHDLLTKFEPNTFDCVLCFDTLEHDDKFWLTVDNMRKVLQVGGYMLIGVPGRNCPLHDHPSDYWRFMPNGVVTMFEGFDDTFAVNEPDDETYMWGRKV